MTKYRLYKNKLEAFLQGDSGARFFNFAYSIGAAIVIWGALFKILHLPGGNLLLSIGMGTEVLMFILNAFDRPAKQPNWEKIFPSLAEGNSQPGVESGQSPAASGTQANAHPVFLPQVESVGITTNEVVLQPSPAFMPEVSPMAQASERYVEQMDSIVNELATLRKETEKMSQNIATLNAIYAGMIQAMAGRTASNPE